MDTVDRLRELNVEIGQWENAGDDRPFRQLLAPHFAFRRANGTVLGIGEFIAALSPGGDRATEVESISVFGGRRALVTCIVTMSGNAFHNVRLFVRADEHGDWQLMAWANDRMTLPIPSSDVV